MRSGSPFRSSSRPRRSSERKQTSLRTRSSPRRTSTSYTLGPSGPRGPGGAGPPEASPPGRLRSASDGGGGRGASVLVARYPIEPDASANPGRVRLPQNDRETVLDLRRADGVVAGILDLVGDV